MNTFRDRAASKSIAADHARRACGGEQGGGAGGGSPPRVGGAAGAPARRDIRPTMPPKLDDCKAFILQALAEAGGVMPMHLLDAAARAQDYSFAAIKWAKRTLKDEGRIRHFQRKINGADVWHTRLLPPKTADTEK